MLKFENKSNGRFYYININKDMLNDLVLSVTYGGINTVRCRILLCGNLTSIHREILRLYKKRLKRGYILIS